jgi:hypothetical protein
MFLDGSKREAETGKAVGKWLSNGRQQVNSQEFTPLAVTLFDRNAASSLQADNRVSVEQ